MWPRATWIPNEGVEFNRAECGGVTDGGCPPKCFGLLALPE